MESSYVCEHVLVILYLEAIIILVSLYSLEIALVIDFGLLWCEMNSLPHQKYGLKESYSYCEGQVN